MQKRTIALHVDGELVELSVRTNCLLVEALRDGCERSCVKVGCESASCGACTVLVEGRPTLSCITLAVDVEGKGIETIESLSAGDELHPLQESFVRHHAVQCGYCTPGMIMAAKALLDQNPDPEEEDVRLAISGNLCRCTGYLSIIRAILDAADVMRGRARSSREGLT
ncbi:(2Fe-2S)-binding protein [Bradyrhizobium sp. 14AA]